MRCAGRCAESSGNANAANYNSNGACHASVRLFGERAGLVRGGKVDCAGSYDVGAWQINSSNWASCSGGNPPCDMNDNLACAIKVWNWGGGSFRYWSTCSQCGAC